MVNLVNLDRLVMWGSKEQQEELEEPVLLVIPDQRDRRDSLDPKDLLELQVHRAAPDSLVSKEWLEFREQPELLELPELLVQRVRPETVPIKGSVENLERKDLRALLDRQVLLELLDRGVTLVNRVLMDRADQMVSRETLGSPVHRAVLVSRDHRVRLVKQGTPDQPDSLDILELLEALDLLDSLVKPVYRVLSDRKDPAVYRV